eukprot:scaffold4457_cov172-Pinguiococcus_pyrenoidosus.AAC.1
MKNKLWQPTRISLATGLKGPTYHTHPHARDFALIDATFGASSSDLNAFPTEGDFRQTRP